MGVYKRDFGLRTKCALPFARSPKFWRLTLLPRDGAWLSAALQLFSC